MERIAILGMEEFLLVTIQGDMHDRQALTLREELGARIVQTRAKGVLIDISALDTLDTFIGRVLADIASMARLLGADAVLAGMAPAVALTLVELGMKLDGVQTALDVDRAMTLLREGRSRPIR